jgi:hypothetical protein
MFVSLFVVLPLLALWVFFPSLAGDACAWVVKKLKASEEKKEG